MKIINNKQIKTEVKSIWKDVLGYEGYYQVSDAGKVRASERDVICSNGKIQHRKAREITPYFDKDGYVRVHLNCGARQTTTGVHRLVAMAFVPGYEEGKEVNHKDCNRQNNSADNLEWVSHYENIRYTKSLKRHVSDRDLTGANNPNWGNKTLHLRYLNDPEAAKAQSRPGAINGRAIPIIMIEGDIEKEYPYIGACARELIDRDLVRARDIVHITNSIHQAAKKGTSYAGRRFRLVA